MRVVGIAIAVALVGTGCSFSLRGPEDADRRPDEPPSCSTSKGLVVMDVLATAALGITAITAGANGESGLAAAATVGGVVFAAAAIRGSGRVDDCRKAEAEHRSWVAAQLGRERAVTSNERDAERDTAAKPEGKTDGNPDGKTETDPLVPALPPSQPPPSSQTASPKPPTAPPTAVPPAAPAKKEPPRSTETDDDWGEFWEEVP